MTDAREQNRRVVDQFSAQAESYARLTGAMAAEAARAAFTALIGASPDDLALDLCCGPGTLALDLAACVADVTGLDLTPAMLAQARAAQAARGATNVTWVTGDANQLPFEDCTFTLVTCSAAFHHLHEPRRVLAEMARVCRPGGRIVVRDVTPETAKSAEYDRMERLRDPSHVHALTAEEMERLGDGLPLAPPELHPSTAADLSLDAILAASFPEACSTADIRVTFLADAIEGADRLGFSARLFEGEIRVSYRQTTAIWRKNNPSVSPY